MPKAYVGQVKGRGGSPKGCDKRLWPLHVKLALMHWARQEFSDGTDTAFFVPRAHKGAVWSENRFLPFLSIMLELFPDESEYLFDEWDGKPARWEKAPKLITERHHKMFYWNDGNIKTRSQESPEHPKFWPEEHLRAAEEAMWYAGFRAPEFKPRRGYVLEDGTP